MNRKRIILWGLPIMVAGLGYFILTSSPLTFDDEAWESHTRSALTTLKQGHLPEAMQHCLEAMRLINSHNVRDMRLIKTYMLLAEIYRWQGEYPEAEEIFILAVRSCAQFYGPMDPAMIIPLENLANFYYYSQMDYTQVALLYNRILEVVEHYHPDDHAEIAIRANNVAQIYHLMKEWEKAGHYHRMTLEHARQNAKVNTISGQMDLSQYLLISADFYSSWGRCDEAVSLGEEALVMRYERTGRDSTIYSKEDIRLDVVVALDVLGQIYLACEKFMQAENTYRTSVSAIKQIRGTNHPDVLVRLNGLAAAFRAQKKDHDAEDCYLRILQIIEKNNLQEYPETIHLLEAHAEFMQSRTTGAKKP